MVMVMVFANNVAGGVADGFSDAYGDVDGDGGDAGHTCCWSAADSSSSWASALSRGEPSLLKSSHVWLHK